MSAAVLAVLALAATWAGGLAFKFFALAIGALVFFEWTQITASRADGRARGLAWALLAAVFTSALLLSTDRFALVAGVASALAVITALVLERGLWTATGFLYALAAGLPLAFLRGDALQGLEAILLLFAVVWATDILAYFTGRALKGPKLAPSISPGKTWSGAIGGAAGGVFFGALVALACGMRLDLVLLLVLLLLSVLSQIGDLFESWVKRRCGVKDSSQLIPGHGGVMDRADGLIAAALALWAMGAAHSGGVDPTAWLFPA